MELKVFTSKHPKTGKKHIDVAEITMSYKGHKVQIYMGSNIQVDVDDLKISGFFKRDAPLLQVLYHIEEYFANEN